MSTRKLLEAIRIVKENERRALESYAEAAQSINNPMGKELFTQLSEFEKYHYEQLSALENSLEAEGDFISYEGKVFPLPPVFEVEAAKDPGEKSVMAILTEAMQLEKDAEEAYADLAQQIPDPKGHEMFSRLSDEEHNHYRVLREAFWALTNLGEWKWSRS